MSEEERGKRSETHLSSPQKIQTEKATWNNKWEFILTYLGYSVGYGNVWRFPYLCYKNGGAAFLIPYYILNLTAALPMAFMEVAIGQYTGMGPLHLFGKMAPILTGLGCSVIMVCLLGVIAYNMIVSWSIFYLFASFTSFLPWMYCNNDFNSEGCYSLTEAANCRNQTRYYYNQSCLSVDDYCSIAHLNEHNLTHCLHSLDGPILADGLVAKISPSEDYFKNRMLGSSGTSWENMGQMRWELVGCQALAWFIIACAVVKGIKTIGKVVYVTATLPYVVLSILLVRGITLDGAYQGIEFYLLKPNITKLTEAEVWSDAAIQVFYSNCISYGTLISLASYNQFNNNCMKNSIIVSLLSSSTSVISGFVIFTVLGFLAKQLGVRVDEVATSGSGLAFVAYPAAVSLMPFPQLWSVLFFLMLLSIGIGTQIPAIETITSALFDQFDWLRSKRAYVSFATCFAMFLLGLTMCLEGGILMFELFFWYSAGLGLIVVAFTELFGIQFVYGYKRFLNNIKEMDISIPCFLEYYWTFAWTVIAPSMLISNGFFYLYYFVPAYWGDYVFPTNIQILGWFLNVSTMISIPIGMIIAWRRTGNWRDLFKPTEDFCPASARKDWSAISTIADSYPQDTMECKFINESQ